MTTEAMIKSPLISDCHNTKEVLFAELEDIVVGKDVLELVSSAMYVDPMTIYREYIQNAADAIDDAKQKGLIAPAERGKVDIMIDHDKRTVRIRDNGSGLSYKEFGRKLTAIGASVKRGTSARGFRGVGRLAGLGYSQELIFRSRVANETMASELRWDCRRLKAALLSAEAKSDIRELIRNVVSIQRINVDAYPEHFFEVELKGVVRLKSDSLMSSVAIGDYLSQVAPVPFAPEFNFGTEITATLGSLFDLGEIDLRIDGLDTPVYRPYRNEIDTDTKHALCFESLEVLQIPGIDGNIAAIAWILHHEYEGALPNGTLIKGLRLRAGNVQVGNHALLEELFPEPRFNSWAVGEIHVLDRRIVPNGRRDHFEQNAHFNNLTNHLGPTTREIARRCRTSSIKRKWLREFESHKNTVRETTGIIRQGSVGTSERERLALSAEQSLLQMEKIAKMDVLISQGGEEAQATVRALKGHLGKVMKDEVTVSSPLMRLPKSQRKKYEHFFELIYQCSTNRTAAKALIDRILLQLS